MKIIIKFISKSANDGRYYVGGETDTKIDNKVSKTFGVKPNAKFLISFEDEPVDVVVGQELEVEDKEFKKYLV